MQLARFPMGHRMNPLRKTRKRKKQKIRKDSRLKPKAQIRRLRMGLLPVRMRNRPRSRAMRKLPVKRGRKLLPVQRKRPLAKRKPLGKFLKLLARQKREMPMKR